MQLPDDEIQIQIWMKISKGIYVLKSLKKKWNFWIPIYFPFFSEKFLIGIRRDKLRIGLFRIAEKNRQKVNNFLQHSEKKYDLFFRKIQTFRFGKEHSSEVVANSQVEAMLDWKHLRERER